MNDLPTDPSGFADKVDDALNALWGGNSTAFDALIDDGDDHEELPPLLKALAGRDISLAEQEIPPPQIPNYQFDAEIGRGGMGIVYSAEQLNPPRRVAIKVLRAAGLQDPVRLRLFQREVHSLARMRHPGIAAIFDAGCSDDGFEYFVMELISGRPLSHLIAAINDDRPTAEQWPLRRRLSLFLDICDAVKAAHQRGVIHRDLKPSNVIVTSDGHAKILDFGVARVSGLDEADQTLITRPGRVIGTLSYMSPEQATGDPDRIDTRSDVYSLGVILYELTCGRLPFDLRNAGPVEATRMICEDAPPRPSSHNAQVRGDVETIILKALAKDPEQRYVGAGALAEDIVRFLTGDPILARPASTLYQLRKFALRYRVAAGTAVGFAALLLIALLVSLRQANLAADAYKEAQVQLVRANESLSVADHERQRAQLQAGRMSEVNEFLTRVLTSASPEEARDNDLTVAELVEKAAIQADADRHPSPQVEFAVRLTLADACRDLRLFDLAERQLKRAAAIADSDELSVEDADAYLVKLSRARLLIATNRLTLAAELLHEILQRGGAVLDHATTIRSRILLAEVFAAQGDPGPAQREFRSAADAALGLSEISDADRVALLEELAASCIQRRCYDDADEFLTHAERLSTSNGGIHHPQTLRIVSHRAAIKIAVGQAAAAESILRETLTAQRDAVGVDHPDTIATSLQLVDVLHRTHKTDEAIAMARDLLNTMKSHYRPSDARFLDAARTLETLCLAVNKSREACDLASQIAASIEQEAIASRTPWLISQCDLANALLQAGRLNEAESIYLRLNDAVSDSRSEFSLTARGRVKFAYGNCAIKLAQPERSIALLAESIDIFKTLPDASAELENALLAIIGVFDAEQNGPKAAEYRRQLAQLRGGPLLAP